MIRHFCDECGAEITRKNMCGKDSSGNRLSGKGDTSKPTPGVLFFDVMTGKGNITNDGEFCKYCVIDAINKLDDRPKQGEPQEQ